MKRYFSAVDYGYKGKTAGVSGYVDGRGHLHITDIYTIDSPTEEPEMELEDAMLIVRHGKTHNFGSAPNRARMALRNEAVDVCKKRAEELMLRAERNAAPVELIDVQIYPDAFAHNRDKLWVKRVFSDGNVTKVLEDGRFAAQLKDTFHAGKKAGAKKVVDERPI